MNRVPTKLICLPKSSEVGRWIGERSKRNIRTPGLNQDRVAVRRVTANHVLHSLDTRYPNPETELTPRSIACYHSTQMIRRATIHDVPRMQEIINSHAELGKMLFKSYAQLYETVRDFGVYELDGAVVGCTAVAILWADLCEIRSLAVHEMHRGKGIGKQLVKWCIEEARAMQIRKLMSLTYEQHFFERLGFVVVSKESLPLKVWSDCVRCPKKENCDEIAMICELQDVPLSTGPVAPPTPRGVSIPVLEHVED